MVSRAPMFLSQCVILPLYAALPLTPHVRSQSTVIQKKNKRLLAYCVFKWYITIFEYSKLLTIMLVLL